MIRLATSFLAGAFALGLCVPAGWAQDPKPPASGSGKTAEAGATPDKGASTKTAPALSKKAHIDLRAGFMFNAPDGWQGVPAQPKYFGMGSADLSRTNGMQAATFYQWEAQGDRNMVVIFWNSDHKGTTDEALGDAQGLLDKWISENSRVEYGSATKAVLSGSNALAKSFREILPAVTIKDAEERAKAEKRRAKKQVLGRMTGLAAGGRCFVVAGWYSAHLDAEFAGMDAMLEKVIGSFRILGEGDLIGLRQKYGKGEVICSDWKTVETAHYRIEFNCDEEFARKLGMHLEAILQVYQSFWPRQMPKTKFRAKCLSSIEGYYKYGGPGGSAGYYSKYQKELVTYKDTELHPVRSRETGEVFEIQIGEPGEISFNIMYHEAFHQYASLYAGENRDVDVPSWFGEGIGDYFFGGNFQKSGKMKGKIKIEENFWRVDTVKRAAATGKGYVRLKDLIRYSQAEYYSNPGNCYAEGWALNYYLLEVAPKKNPAMAKRYQSIPIIMLDEFEKHGDGRKATEKAFEGIDIDALEKDWKAWLAVLEQPARYKEAVVRAELKADADAVEEGIKLAEEHAADLTAEKGEKVEGTVALIVRTTSGGKFRATAQGALVFETKTIDLAAAKKLVDEALAKAGDPAKVCGRLYVPDINPRAEDDELKKIFEDFQDLRKYCRDKDIKDVVPASRWKVDGE